MCKIWFCGKYAREWIVADIMIIDGRGPVGVERYIRRCEPYCQHHAELLKTVTEDTMFKFVKSACIHGPMP